MIKLSRVVFWGGVFVATIALAIGVSLLALRVRAAVDARRNPTCVQVGATPVSCPLGAPAAADTKLETSQMPCVSDEDICDGPWGIEPASSSPAAQPTGPAAEPTVAVRGCCGEIKVIPTPIPQTAPEAAAPAGAPTATPQPTPQYRANCH